MIFWCMTAVLAAVVLRGAVAFVADLCRRRGPQKKSRFQGGHQALLPAAPTAPAAAPAERVAVRPETVTTLTVPRQVVIEKTGEHYHSTICSKLRFEAACDA